ncbi:thiol-disulfide isomerase/thioredoxin [Pullulanibacillus pueri]|uniref:Thiol-disulfide oxidoreductase YkuV n=1 Tax=Pullulanibacillus pueri TaxID=1437324 RepID=A0A8J2ZUZ1_9BACL|nr:TlpA disulfide reductase family protein [Pullulanibacillus pueri]MBM7680725.1 thiol-disulfide isomerase/thioredoxin [Pullulanibacillus pueri]GGH78092.1 thiol-disulfide oxidoreductase YkuV [Pullulanibacillus pueri]
MRIREKMPAIPGAATWINHEVSREELIGEKPTLVHFWSVSCDICKEALPVINGFRDAFKNKLNLLAVHLPLSEEDLDIEQVKVIAKRYNITQPIFVDNRHQLTDAFANEYVPAYYLFDTEGRLRHYQAGEHRLKRLEKRVHRILEENKNGLF